MTAAKINLKQLRADTESVPPGFDALYEIHRDDLLALIDTAEAAIAWAKRHDDPTIHGFDHYHRLRETLNHYTTNK
jgi:hypothetical protein